MLDVKWAGNVKVIRDGLITVLNVKMVVAAFNQEKALVV